MFTDLLHQFIFMFHNEVLISKSANPPSMQHTYRPTVTQGNHALACMLAYGQHFSVNKFHECKGNKRDKQDKKSDGSKKVISWSCGGFEKSRLR